MNKAKCRHCGDIVHSKHRHDFVTCKCFNDSAEAVRRFQEQMGGEWTDDVQKYSDAHRTGFFLDGGDEYCRYGGNFDHIEWITDED